MFGLRNKNTVQVEIGEAVVKIEKKPFWAQVIQKCKHFYIILKFSGQLTEL